MRENASAALGFLAASTTPPLIISVVWPLGDELNVISFAGTFVATYPFSAGFILLLGVPVYFLLRRFAPGRWWLIPPIGFFLGMPVAALLRPSSHIDLHDAMWGGSLASASALVFWLVWQQARNPNRREETSGK